MAEDDVEELTDEEAEAVLLASLGNTIEAALEEEGDPFNLLEVKTTRRGRVVAYFEWDTEALEAMADEEE